MPDEPDSVNSPQNSDLDQDQTDRLLKPEDHLNAVEHPTDEAVDDIIQNDGNDQLEAQDQEIAQAFDNRPETWKEKISRLFHAWWNNKNLRNSSLAGVGALALVLILLPTSRYFMLNTVGVRSRASIFVYDQSTHSPLKNVTVTLGTAKVTTNSEGKANLFKVRLGQQKLTITKRAFADFSKTITVGWGSNPLGNFDVKPVGAQYVFVVTDWLSGKPVTAAEANSGDYDAAADDHGRLVLTVDAQAADVLDVDIIAANYLKQTIKLDLSSKQLNLVKLVASRKEVFVSKRSGHYDLYKIDVDGQDEQLLLAGTGLETDNIALLSHPTDEVVAFVSTRDDVRNQDGYRLSSLNIIDVDDGSPEQVAQSEEIRLIGWHKNRLVYEQIVAGASGGNSQRKKLFSYDYKTNDRIELASSNDFSDIVLIDDMVYYAPGNLYNSKQVNNVYRQRVDGTNKSSIIAREAYNIFRTGYDQLVLSVGQDWYNYKLGDAKAYRRSDEPSNLANRRYIDNPDSKTSLWTEERDGKGTLLLYDQSSQQDKTLVSQSGLQTPIRWLNGTTLIYRIQTPGESADYVISTQGGLPKKIRDVTKTVDIR